MASPDPIGFLIKRCLELGTCPEYYVSSGTDKDGKPHIECKLILDGYDLSVTTESSIKDDAKRSAAEMMLRKIDAMRQDDSSQADNSSPPAAVHASAEVESPPSLVASSPVTVASVPTKIDSVPTEVSSEQTKIDSVQPVVNSVPLAAASPLPQVLPPAPLPVTALVAEQVQLILSDPSRLALALAQIVQNTASANASPSAPVNGSLEVKPNAESHSNGGMKSVIANSQIEDPSSLSGTSHSSSEELNVISNASKHDPSTIKRTVPVFNQSNGSSHKAPVPTPVPRTSAFHQPPAEVVSVPPEARPTAPADSITNVLSAISSAGQKYGRPPSRASSHVPNSKAKGRGGGGNNNPRQRASSNGAKDLRPRQRAPVDQPKYFANGYDGGNSDYRPRTSSNGAKDVRLPQLKSELEFTFSNGSNDGNTEYRQRAPLNGAKVLHPPQREVVDKPTQFTQRPPREGVHTPKSNSMASTLTPLPKLLAQAVTDKPPVSPVPRTSIKSPVIGSPEKKDRSSASEDFDLFYEAHCRFHYSDLFDKVRPLIDQSSSDKSKLSTFIDIMREQAIAIDVVPTLSSKQIYKALFSIAFRGVRLSSHIGMSPVSQAAAENRAVENAISSYFACKLLKTK